MRGMAQPVTGLAVLVGVLAASRRVRRQSPPRQPRPCAERVRARRGHRQPPAGRNRDRCHPLFAGARLLCHQHRRSAARGRRRALPHAGHRARSVPDLRRPRGLPRRRGHPDQQSGHRYLLAGRGQRPTRLHPDQPRDRSDDCRALHVRPRLCRLPGGQRRRDRHPVPRSQPTATVQGTIDAHTHVTAFEFLGGAFHCGRPWHPFGIEFALPDCASVQKGTNGQTESFLDYGSPIRTTRSAGRPSRTGRHPRTWPRRATTTPGSSGRGRPVCG